MGWIVFELRSLQYKDEEDMVTCCLTAILTWIACDPLTSLHLVESSQLMGLFRVRTCETPKYPFHPDLNPNSIKRADWKIGNIYIEYAGLLQNNEYFEKIETKKSLANVLGLQIIVVEAENLLNLTEVIGSFAST